MTCEELIQQAIEYVMDDNGNFYDKDVIRVLAERLKTALECMDARNTYCKCSEEQYSMH